MKAYHLAWAFVANPKPLSLHRKFAILGPAEIELLILPSIHNSHRFMEMHPIGEHNPHMSSQNLILHSLTHPPTRI